MAATRPVKCVRNWRQHWLSTKQKLTARLLYVSFAPDSRSSPPLSESWIRSRPWRSRSDGLEANAKSWLEVSRPRPRSDSMDRLYLVTSLITVPQLAHVYADVKSTPPTERGQTSSVTRDLCSWTRWWRSYFVFQQHRFQWCTYSATRETDYAWAHDELGLAVKIQVPFAFGVY